MSSSLLASHSAFIVFGLFSADIKKRNTNQVVFTEYSNEQLDAKTPRISRVLDAIKKKKKIITWYNEVGVDEGRHTGAKSNSSGDLHGLGKAADDAESESCDGGNNHCYYMNVRGKYHVSVSMTGEECGGWVCVSALPCCIVPQGW